MFTTGVLENETWYFIQTNSIRYKSKRTLDILSEKLSTLKSLGFVKCITSRLEKIEQFYQASFILFSILAVLRCT